MTRPWPPARARDLPTRHRRALEQLTTTLLDQETTSGHQVRRHRQYSRRWPAADTRAASQQA